MESAGFPPGSLYADFPPTVTADTFSGWAFM
jgi:hypothetical protein